MKKYYKTYIEIQNLYKFYKHVYIFMYIMDLIRYLLLIMLVFVICSFLTDTKF